MAVYKASALVGIPTMVLKHEDFQAFVNQAGIKSFITDGTYSGYVEGSIFICELVRA